MQVCDNVGHQAIAFEGTRCPMCRMYLRIGKVAIANHLAIREAIRENHSTTGAEHAETHHHGS